MTRASEGDHPDLAPDRKPRTRNGTRSAVGRAARPATLAFPLRPASSRGGRGPWGERFGWWLMGLPSGVREPWSVLLRFGPYRWGAWLVNREGGLR